MSRVRSAPNSRAPRLVLLSLVAVAPVDAYGAEAQASLEVTAQVVRGNPSAAEAAALISRIERIETAATRDSAGPLIQSGNGCNAVGATLIPEAWATCSWEPDSGTYLVTIRY